MKLEKRHNPVLNRSLLNMNESSIPQLAETLAKGMEMFHVEQNSMENEKRINVLTSGIWRKAFFYPFLTRYQGIRLSASYYIEKDGIPYPVWKKVLDREEGKLEKAVKKEVNVADFGAVGDGKTDNTKAFKRALGAGKIKVTVPAGVFIVKGLKLPDWVILSGSGKAKTVLKLHDKAPKRRRLLTNSSHKKGNHHIKVEDLTLDWNIERLENTKKTSSGNNFSSCLTYANVTCGWVKRVEAQNAGLHGFDISSRFYTYAGDGTRAKGASKYIWLDELTGYGFGDDGVTTHHSGHILISNSHMASPSGRAHRKGFSNSNGFEIDDGSYDVWLSHNSSSGCFGGVEVKAHKYASAAVNTVIIGHLSVRDNRSFNFRHIGHHLASDAESKTACGIVAINLKALEPVHTDLYKNSTPRALVVSAYKNVFIHSFSATGNPDYQYQNHPAVSIQYRSRNVFLHHFRIKDFRGCSSAIQVAGGPQKADQVVISEVTAENSATVTVKIGKNVKSCLVTNAGGRVKH